MIQIDMDIPKTCDDCPFHIYHSGKNYVCVATPLFYPMNLANYKDGRKDFCPLIEVAQEPKKGHWKLVQRGKSIDVCCSNCKAVRIKGYAYNYTIDQLDKEDVKECFECADMRYCPNCGAKMVEPQESEDKE